MNSVVNFSKEYIQKVANIVRTRLTDASEEEITTLSYACILRLRQSGIKKLDPEDGLIKLAIRCFAKGNYGYDSDTDKYLKQFEALRTDLSLDSEYNSGEEYFGE